ncbi:MAG: hypothetical protein VR64_23475 [Desulfatitalea sp. BRH_c12]|nr:MAG: hypothetical protein VR64_23475 [Desulfatitalea sp. BRH_c12]
MNLNNRKITITLCGDIAFCRGVEAYFLSNGSLPIEEELLRFLHKTDVFIGNLECPLTDNPTPKWHHFKTLKASIKSGEMLRTLGLDAVSLANNHIADYGQRGLKDTIDYLQKSRIQWGGAGFSKKQAQRPIVITKNGYRIGVLNLAQPEISAISNLGWGAAVLEPCSAVQQMQKLVSETDIAIGFLHMGVEFFNYPTPNQVALCRALIKAGARIVVCHHAHVPQGYEKYQSGFIAYGLGNFLFDMKPIANTDSRIGIVLRVSFDNLQIRDVELQPIETANGYTCMLNHRRTLSSKADLKQLSASLDDSEELLKQHYFTCRDNMMIHVKAFFVYGLFRKNLLKMQDLFRQQRWPQIFDMRRCLLRYLLTGDALRHEHEKSRTPKTIESAVWRCLCVVGDLLGKIVPLHHSPHRNNLK